MVFCYGSRWLHINTCNCLYNSAVSHISLHSCRICFIFISIFLQIFFCLQALLILMYGISQVCFNKYRHKFAVGKLKSNLIILNLESVCVSATHFALWWGLTNVPPASWNILEGIKVNKDNTDLHFSELQISYKPFYQHISLLGSVALEHQVEGPLQLDLLCSNKKKEHSYGTLQTFISIEECLNCLKLSTLILSSVMVLQSLITLVPASSSVGYKSPAQPICFQHATTFSWQLHHKEVS